MAAGLRPYALRITRCVRTAEPDAGLGREVGFALMDQGDGATEVVGATVRFLLDGVPDDLGGWGTGPRRRSPPAGWPRWRGAWPTASRTPAGTRDAAQQEMQRRGDRRRATTSSTRLARPRVPVPRAVRAAGDGHRRLPTSTGGSSTPTRAWADLLGYPLDEMCGRSVAEIVMPGGRRPRSGAGAEMIAGSRDHVRMENALLPQGRPACLDRPDRVRCARLDGRPRFTVAIVDDITDRHELEERLRHQALHDPLTGLPNRTLFFERLEKALAAPAAAGRPVLPRPRRLQGGQRQPRPRVGDRLLVEVADRLQSCATGPGELVARLGGDEFVAPRRGRADTERS